MTKSPNFSRVRRTVTALVDCLNSYYDTAVFAENPDAYDHQIGALRNAHRAEQRAEMEPHEIRVMRASELLIAWDDRANDDPDGVPDGPADDEMAAVEEALHCPCGSGGVAMFTFNDGPPECDGCTHKKAALIASGMIGDSREARRV